MTKARDLSKLLSTSNGKIAGSNLDVSFENISDTGTEGTKVASGTTAQRGNTAGQWRFNSDTGYFEGRNSSEFSSLEPVPTVTSIDISEVDSTAGGNQTVVVTGTNFTSGGVIAFVGSSAEFNASTTTFNNATQVTAVAPKSSFLNAQEPYKVKFTASSGTAGISSTGFINIDSTPTFGVASGTLGTLPNGNRASSGLTTVTATDAEGDSITFAKTSGTIPTGITLNSNGTWSGTANAETSNTTYNFTITATANSKTTSRAYSIIVSAPTVLAFTYTGATQTFTIPAGVTSIQTKVWGAAGAGHDEYYSQSGGAGGFGIGTINVSGMSSLNVVVGQGGRGKNTVNPVIGSGNKVATYGHLVLHSNGENGGWGCVGGTGGGLSGIFNGATNTQSNAIVIAGGGGAAGSLNAQGQADGQGGQGGGFNQTGADGGYQSDGAYGRGGNLSYGGNNGRVYYSRTSNDGTNGIALAGGHGNTITNGSSEGGGGGSGYFGGGAGAHGAAGGQWCAAGGGSGYANTSLVSNITSAKASGIGQANTVAEADANWVSNASSPVAGNNSGGNGRIVIIY